MVGSRRNAQLLAALFAGVLAGCNVPFRGGDIEPPASVSLGTPAATTAAAAPTGGLPTAPPGSHAEPFEEGIAHFEPEQLVLITAIHMISPSVGWGIGGGEGGQGPGGRA